MALVGPGGSGIFVSLIRCLLRLQHFIQLSKKNFLLLQRISTAFPRNAEKINIEFLPCLDPEMIKNLENSLLLFDVSCEAIYQEQTFVILAVASRHRNLHGTFVKHNLFHQHRWSHTINLNNHMLFYSNHHET